MSGNVSRIGAILLLVALFGILLNNCSQMASSEKKMTPEEMVKRGAYVVLLGGCGDCHSPKNMTPMGPVPDPSRILSGHSASEVLAAMPAGIPGSGPWMAATNAGLTAWAGPWGISFAANLTPDQTGLGDWTEDQFVAAMKTGKHQGVGRPILPPMPWQEIGMMKDEDLRAVFAYLKTIPAIPNLVPGPIEPPAAPSDSMAH